MKHLGMREGKIGCQCSYCIGDNTSKAAHRALKKRGRRADKKRIKISLESIDDQASQSES